MAQSPVLTVTLIAAYVKSVQALFFGVNLQDPKPGLFLPEQNLAPIGGLAKPARGFVEHFQLDGFSSEGR